MAIYRNQTARYFRIVSAIALIGDCAIASGNRALAQTPSNIVPDATLGAESSVVVPNFDGLPVEAIGGGALRGQNLFHSTAFRNLMSVQAEGLISSALTPLS